MSSAKSKKDNYSILEYFLNNSGLTIGLLSIVTAIVITTLYTALYISDAAILRQWDVPIALVDISNKTRVFKLGITTLTFVLSGSFAIYAALYFENRRFFFDVLAANKAQRKLLLSDDGMDRDQELTIEVVDSNIKQLRRHIFRDFFWKLLFPSVIIIFILTSIQAYTYASQRMIWITLFLYPLFFVFLALNNWGEKYHRAKKKYFDLPSINKKRIEIDQVLDYKFLSKRILSNDSIIMNSILLMVFLIFLFSITCYEGRYDAEHMKSFPIISENNQTKAVVYLTDNYAIVESAIVEGDSITIDVSKQEIVDIKTLQYSVIEFDGVNKSGSLKSDK